MSKTFITPTDVQKMILNFGAFAPADGRSCQTQGSILSETWQYPARVPTDLSTPEPNSKTEVSLENVSGKLEKLDVSAGFEFSVSACF